MAAIILRQPDDDGRLDTLGHIPKKPTTASITATSTALLRKISGTFPGDDWTEAQYIGTSGFWFLV